jgi:hypothetical protein
MKNIENYKRRFYTLMESTMGDVKPLISEAPQYEEYVEPKEEDFMVRLLDKDGDFIPYSDRGYSNYEYKITAKPGSYEPNEIVTLAVSINVDDETNQFSYLKVSDPLKYSGNAVRGKLKQMRLKPGLSGLVDDINLQFEMPSTQKEYDRNQPFEKYAEVKFDNVRGGKIKFTILFPDVTINE